VGAALAQFFNAIIAIFIVISHFTATFSAVIYNMIFNIASINEFVKIVHLFPSFL
jgi:hypothetical protein